MAHTCMLHARLCWFEKCSVTFELHLQFCTPVHLWQVSLRGALSHVCVITCITRGLLHVELDGPLLRCTPMFSCPCTGESLGPRPFVTSPIWKFFVPFSPPLKPFPRFIIFSFLIDFCTVGGHSPSCSSHPLLL